MGYCAIQVPADQIASLTVFLEAWRTDLPFIVLRSSSGAFTHCGLCDYLTMLIGNCADAELRKTLLLRLGRHYDFQAAQRQAIYNIFREGERNPCGEWVALGTSLRGRAPAAVRMSVPRINISV